MNNEHSSRKQTYKTVAYEVLSSAAAELHTTEERLAELIGYTKTVTTHWRKAEKIPAVAGLACEALLHRQCQPTLVVLQVPADKLLAVRAILETLSIAMKEF